MGGKCHLCGKKSDLQKSHIIPSFVFRWLKETSPGFIRNLQNPNVRTQDGLKMYMLCSDCEQLFSRWEREFATEIFYPLHSKLGEHQYLNYGVWCLKYAVSVSWRVLRYGLYKGINNFNSEQLEAAKKAEEVWREFLLGIRKHPGDFYQHLVPLNIIESINFPRPSALLNRYILRSTDLDIPSNDEIAFVYVKMGRIALFGIIYDRFPKHWTGTKLHLRKGVIGRKRVVLPAGMDEYLNYRSNKAASILANMSERQKNTVNQMINDKLDFLHEYEIFNAINQDFLLFGDEAINITNKKLIEK
jgi:hypothetical protein